MKLLRFVFFVLIANNAFAIDRATDAISISDQIASDVESLFYQRDYQSINEMDDQLRLKQSRLPDGRWQLTFIYTGFGIVSARGAEAEWQFKLKLVDEWIKATPRHPAPYLAKAEILISYGWDARGTGYGSSVTDEQWSVFHQRIAEARKVLEDSSSISGSHPYWFVEMETIANAQSWSVLDFNRLYDIASDMYPTYYYIYFAAADYFLPRWHGSKLELRNFVDAAVGKSEDKEGLTLYTRIYWSLLWALKDGTFDTGYAEWSFMKHGFEDIMRDYPDSIWNLNAFAYYSCMAEDWDTAKSLINRIKNNPHLGIWGSNSKYYACLSLAESA